MSVFRGPTSSTFRVNTDNGAIKESNDYTVYLSLPWLKVWRYAQLFRGEKGCEIELEKFAIHPHILRLCSSLSLAFAWHYLQPRLSLFWITFWINLVFQRHLWEFISATFWNLLLLNCWQNPKQTEFPLRLINGVLGCLQRIKPALLSSIYGRSHPWILRLSIHFNPEILNDSSLATMLLLDPLPSLSMALVTTKLLCHVFLWVFKVNRDFFHYFSFVIPTERSLVNIIKEMKKNVSYENTIPRTFVNCHCPSFISYHLSLICI